MELDETFNVLVAELERETFFREKVEEEARNLREEADSLKGKVEEVRKEVRVRSKNRDGGMGQNRLY